MLPRMWAWFCALVRAPRPVPRCGGPMGTVTPIGMLMRHGVNGVLDGPGVKVVTQTSKLISAETSSKALRSVTALSITRIKDKCRRTQSPQGYLWSSRLRDLYTV